MTDPRHDFTQVLNRIVRSDGVEGAEVMRRDGQCVAEAFRPNLDVPTYSRLSAALALAGENSLPELKASRSRRLVTKSDRHRLVVVEANDRLLVAALVQPDGAADRLLRLVEDAAGEIDKMTAA